MLSILLFSSILITVGASSVSQLASAIQDARFDELERLLSEAETRKQEDATADSMGYTQAPSLHGGSLSDGSTGSY